MGQLGLWGLDRDKGASLDTLHSCSKQKKKKRPMNEIGAEQAVAWRGLRVLKAWRWHRVGKNGDSLTPVPPTLTFPPWGHMPTDSCASASHQVLTPQLISKEPVLPADPNISSLHPSQGLLGLGCQGRGSGSREGTPLTCFHLTGWLLVSEES